MLTLSEVADIVGGRIEGDANCKLTELKSLQTATSSSLSYCRSSMIQSTLQTSQAGAVILSQSASKYFSGNKIIVDSPYDAYAKISHHFRKYAILTHQGISSNTAISDQANLDSTVSVGIFSHIGKGAKIATGVIIGDQVHIGEDVEIGANTIVAHQVVIHSGCKVGANCHVSSGAVIGASGFGYSAYSNTWRKIEHLGCVVIGDNVDIGANTTIDRGSLEDTVIADGVKMDNLIHVAHNVRIGKHTAIAGCVGIAGSTTIGKRCQLGGRAAILDHITICDDVTILANGQVTKDINKSGTYGSMLPVQESSIWNKNLAKLRRLYKK